MSSLAGFGLQIDFTKEISPYRTKQKRFDIFTFTHYDKGLGANGAGYYLRGNDNRQGSIFPKMYFKDKTSVLPLKDCLMWDIKVKCPNGKDILANEYGADAFTKMIKWNHDNTGNGVKIDLMLSENAHNLLPMMNKRLIEKLHFGEQIPLKTYDEL